MLVWVIRNDDTGFFTPGGSAFWFSGAMCHDFSQAMHYHCRGGATTYCNIAFGRKGKIPSSKQMQNRIDNPHISIVQMEINPVEIAATKVEW